VLKNRPGRFDERYYRRYYLDPVTRAVAPGDDRRRAQFIGAYLKHLGAKVSRILDVGCGLGRTLRSLQRQFPQARCVGVEYSPYLCERYGWDPGSVGDYSVRVPFDLVVCNDVLPALDDTACAAAIENLASLSRQALYLGVLTREDWARCDQRRTDRNVYLRPAAWYERRLRQHFGPLGGGLYLKHDADVQHWSLDRMRIFGKE
jgi:SAM-dependent methyltransferase